MKKTLVLLMIILSMNIHSSFAQTTPRKLLVAGIMTPNKQFNDLSVLSQEETHSYQNVVKDYFEKLLQLPGDKVLRIGGDNVCTRSTAMHQEPMIVDGKRYGVVVIYNEKEDLYQLVIRSTALDGGYPIETISFDYDPRAKKGYISDACYSVGNRRIYVGLTDIKIHFNQHIEQIDKGMRTLN